MSKPVSEIDRLIREALSQEDAALLDELGEPTLPEMVTETFRGRHQLLLLATMAIGTVFMVVSIYCTVRFLGAADSRSMILWGAGGAFSIAAVSLMKVWYWLELFRNSLVREIKRVELQIAYLAQRLAGR